MSSQQSSLEMLVKLQEVQARIKVVTEKLDIALAILEADHAIKTAQVTSLRVVK